MKIVYFFLSILELLCLSCIWTLVRYLYRCAVHFGYTSFITHQRNHCHNSLKFVYIKSLKIPLHVSILRSSSVSTFCSLLKLYLKKLITTLYVPVMRQHIVCMCICCICCREGGRSVGRSVLNVLVQGASTHGPRSSLPCPAGHFEKKKLQTQLNKK